MAHPKKSDGRGRPNKAAIYLPENIWAASAMDREHGRFNEKMNRVAEALYCNGGRVDTLEILEAEIRAEMGRLEAQLRSLGAQREAIEELQRTEVATKKAEETFRQRVRQARDKGVNDWKMWLNPARSDVKAVGGMVRAKQIMKEEGVELQ